MEELWLRGRINELHLYELFVSWQQFQINEILE